MKQCLKITFSSDFDGKFLQGILKAQALKLGIEGTAKSVDNKIQIIACGLKEKMEVFVDIIYKGSKDIKPDDIEVEPFLKEKEYRGVFRVIE